MAKKIQADIDRHKLMYHPERVSEWLTSGDCSPIYVEIGPTNRCNHRCQFCALDWLTRGGSDIDSGVLLKNLKDMAQHGVKAVMFAGEGEPFLHREMPEFVRIAKTSGMDVSITTNGVAFTKEEADKTLPYLTWIRFSIDAGTRETYAVIHGTRKEDFERVMKNIANAVEIRNKNHYPATIGTQVLLTRQSLSELEILARRLKEIGADNLQIKPYSHHPSSKNNLSFNYDEAKKLRPEIESLGNEKFQIIYRTGTIKRILKRREYSECHGLTFFALIAANGDVIPCNMFYSNPEFTYGNINYQIFSEIWKGEKRKEIIAKLKSGGLDGCRAGCRLDAINKYLDRIKHPEGHDNFI